MIGLYKIYSGLIMNPTSVTIAYPSCLNYSNNVLVIGFSKYFSGSDPYSYARIATYNRAGDEFVFSDVFTGVSYAGTLLVLNNTATVLGVYDGTPKITIYDRIDSSWVSRAATLSTTTSISDFGMTADGKKIVVLKGQSIETYTELNGIWTLVNQNPLITISWLGCVTLSNNGNHLYVGDSYKDTPVYRAGVVKHYEWNGSYWDNLQEWVATTPIASGYFGRYVKLSDDNTKILIGNYDQANTRQVYDLIGYNTLANEIKFNVNDDENPSYFCDDDWIVIENSLISLYRTTDRYISGTITQVGVPCGRSILMTPPDQTTPILYTTNSNGTTGQFTIPVFVQTDVGLIIRSSNKTADNDIIHKITPATE